ncbi:hypothetical protein cyc_09012 [Cyclospora cayetanensis]|uniref:Uncharacterized protein n=1 Tax=Cyclospora cayetanensis TaxID=88456 RepID=A0A1D3D1R1_9EIME|nr:hypothetical protein cyc_09012 [Cyclospora cayetanensis]
MDDALVLSRNIQQHLQQLWPLLIRYSFFGSHLITPIEEAEAVAITLFGRRTTPPVFVLPDCELHFLLTANANYKEVNVVPP